MVEEENKLTISVHVGHRDSRVEGQIEDAQPPLPAAGREEHGDLDVDAVLLGELVVVLDLAGQGHVAVEGGQLHVGGVCHVERAEEVSRSDPSARTNSHDRVKHDVSAHVPLQVVDKSFPVQVRLEVCVLVHLTPSQPANLEGKGITPENG